MIVEYIRYKTEPGGREKFIDAYRRGAAHLDASPHCLAYEITECADEPGRFIVRIEWASPEAHLEGFRKGADFPPFYECVKPFFQTIEEMRHYRLTDIRNRK